MIKGVSGLVLLGFSEIEMNLLEEQFGEEWSILRVDTQEALKEALDQGNARVGLVHVRDSRSVMIRNILEEALLKLPCLRVDLRRAMTSMMMEVMRFGTACFIPFKNKIFDQKFGEIFLGEKESRLLAFLLEQPFQKASKEALLEQIWHYDRACDTHTLETHVYQLRQKLKRLHPIIEIIKDDEGCYGLKLPHR